MTSPGEGTSVFTTPYLSAGALSQGEDKGLNNGYRNNKFIHKNQLKKLIIFSALYKNKIGKIYYSIFLCSSHSGKFIFLWGDDN